MAPVTGFVILTALATCVMAACVPECPEQSDENGPTITGFQFEQQFPSDPYTAVFGFSYQTEGAALGEGIAEFYVGSSQTPVKVKIAELMSASGVDRTSLAADLGAALRFSRENINDGDIVEMRLQLVDDEGLRSNCARVSLRFDFPE